MASAKKAAARRICSPTLRKEVSHFDLIPLCRSNSNISPVHLERKQYVPLIPPCVLDDFTEGSRSRVVYQPSYSVGQTPAQELSPQKETGSQCFLASATLCWASRNPGLHLLRQKVFSTPKPGNPVLSPFYHQPPFPVLKTYADVLKSAINSSDMAKEETDPEGWRVMDRRRQQVRGRSSGLDSWSSRGRENWEVRGRGSWRRRGNRFHTYGGSFGSDARVIVAHSSGMQTEPACKQVADVTSGVADKGKKRRDELCCEICEDNHVPEECPVFNGPKPQAALCGFAGGESGFFQIHTWGCKGCYSKVGWCNCIHNREGRVELQRMIAMKYVHTLGGEVGSILGATQKVDMRYTRKMGVVRILVAVTDVNHIPESAEIIVGEGLYEIFFKVDKVLKDGRWIDKDNMDYRDGDDKEQGENEDYSEKHGNDSFPMEEVAEDTVMRDNSLQSDHNKPNDGALVMGMVVLQGNQNNYGSTIGTGVESEDSTFNEPTTLMPTSSSCSAQYALLVPKSAEALVLEPKIGLTDLSPGDLDQTPENVGEDANLSSLYDLVPSCSILAGMTDGAGGLNLADDSLQTQAASKPLSGGGAGLALIDASNNSQVDNELIDELIMSTDTQERAIHLGDVNSFAEVPRSVLQEAIMSNSLAKRVKTEKLSQGDSRISVKRTNTDEDILTKAQRLGAKRNLETSHFQRYSLVKVLETSTEEGNTSTNS
ncbi:uncharacterized protein [Zea mays]|uniref:uncharacterized protein isoform X2 n=1 Tax=Zea mays TaxID=4577 RepID=UPI0009AAB760|nr:uncharacterized protein LOC103650306 isoform X2 [Zea mays]|eukprot:XP_008674134.2 uncharacterized protein LOC103650306 isoform X2 [Zea mays]